jgi:hypothetical protein
MPKTLPLLSLSVFCSFPFLSFPSFPSSFIIKIQYYYAYKFSSCLLTLNPWFMTWFWCHTHTDSDALEKGRICAKTVEVSECRMWVCVFVSWKHYGVPGPGRLYSRLTVFERLSFPFSFPLCSIFLSFRVTMDLCPQKLNEPTLAIDLRRLYFSWRGILSKITSTDKKREPSSLLFIQAEFAERIVRSSLSPSLSRLRFTSIKVRLNLIRENWTAKHTCNHIQMFAGGPFAAAVLQQ